MNIIEVIISSIFNIISFLIHLILLPIDLLIANYLPDVSSLFANISEYIEIALTYVGFIISITGIPPAMIGLLAAYWTYILTIPIQVWFIKLAVAWWHRLKP